MKSTVLRVGSRILFKKPGVIGRKTRGTIAKIENEHVIVITLDEKKLRISKEWITDEYTGER